MVARGETALHKTLKKEACRWLFRSGYQCIAAEVKLHQLGIIDSVGTGLFGPYFNHLKDGTSRHQSCLVECKASRGDFLRDLTHDGQMQLALIERAGNTRRKRRGRKSLRQRVGLGKFDACLMQPFANLHYVLAPAGLLKKEEIPHRWGLLVLGDGGVSVVKAAVWQETAAHTYIECQIARTLTGDIYRADDRAMGSVNREIAYQQQALAEKIRALREQLCDPIVEQMKDVDLFGEGVTNAIRAASTRTKPTATTISHQSVQITTSRPARRRR
jgi:hypothetical protein